MRSWLPRTAHPFVAVAPGTVQIINGRGILFGWTLRMAAAGTLDIFDGPAANGLQIGTGQVTAAGALATADFGPHGVYFDNALVVVTTGAGANLTGAVYYMAETRINEWLVDQESRAAVVLRRSQQFPDSLVDEYGV